MQTILPTKIVYRSLLLCSFALLGSRPASRIPAMENAGPEEKGKFHLNRNARIFVNNYIRENKEILQTVQLRSGRPFKMIDAIFSRYGLPKEVKYLAVIESELKPTALSKVGARGPWQLMPETAQLLGLQVDSTQDERIQYYKSTVAAAKYLKDLYGEFGDWLLVIAAYNGGAAQVYHAIHKAGSRNFWELQNYLPAESRMHVKKFIATHYYFEGQGSVATATKAECLACATNLQTVNREEIAAFIPASHHASAPKHLLHPSTIRPATLSSNSATGLFL